MVLIAKVSPGQKEDLDIHRTYCGEHLLWIGIAKPSLMSPSYWGAKSRENDNVIRAFLKNTFQSFLGIGHGQGATLLGR